MSKKTTEPTEPTEPSPDHDAIIAEGIQVGLDWIAERYETKIRWSTPNVATMRNAARSDVVRALRPPPLKLPPRPTLVTAPPTNPPAADRAAQRRRIEEASGHTIDVADLIDQDRRRAGLPSLPDAGDGVDGG